MITGELAFTLAEKQANRINAIPLLFIVLQRIVLQKIVLQRASEKSLVICIIA